MTLEATRLRNNRWAVRPVNALGTMGWRNGKAWTVVYVTAKDANDAINKAVKKGGCYHD